MRPQSLTNHECQSLLKYRAGDSRKNAIRMAVVENLPNIFTKFGDTNRASAKQKDHAPGREALAEQESQPSRFVRKAAKLSECGKNLAGEGTKEDSLATAQPEASLLPSSNKASWLAAAVSGTRSCLSGMAMKK